ncbi:DUF4331 domain-containing protein [Streptomyces sporangiiformans]|uniref:DUF4331 domain-containing protein n=1 Tax=Streptomyces sporangiiformans TaxID=2315329 RepID=A0A505D7T7_9ACTN|nr:DUF4331 domain-containing protein [Streptomyces sporangiiformans]TPQ18917.1 DUF4331 domain-containing protein [Streptomyces sporangiiformans]
MTPNTRRIVGRRSLATLVCGALATGGLAAAGVTALEPGTASASSHREAPLISGQPQFDNTDLYAFASPDKPDTTTIVANVIPMEEPAGGPNFYTFAEDAQYDIHIDKDGDAQGDLLFRYTFDTDVKNDKSFLYNTGPVESLDDPDLNITQTYDLEVLQLKDQRLAKRTKIADDAPVAPSNVGKASMPDYGKLRDQAIQELGGYEAKSFAGQADDPFFADLRVFDLLYGGNLTEVGNDTLKEYNTNSIALQLPNELIRESAEQPNIGIWTTTNRKSASGHFRQVSRLGNPLVNEVVNPLKDKDTFNASAPWDDAQFLKNVTNPELPKLIEAIYKIPAPDEPRNDLVDVFLKGVDGLNQPPHVTPSEMLRLNTSIKAAKKPKRLGVLDGDNAGFPNGRRLTDDVIDASLQVVEGELLGAKNDLGDAVNENDKKFEKEFPFVAEPTPGSRGPLAKGTDATKGDVRNQLGDALTPAGAGGSGNITSMDDTTLIAVSAVSGAAGFLLLGTGVLWWRSRRRVNGYY